uniref:Uncharacterized protein n=1 Tax=Glossina brevipalpis TaxID=37001 RepID=A0A1A9W896_9MUSC
MTLSNAIMQCFADIDQEKRILLELIFGNFCKLSTVLMCLDHSHQDSHYHDHKHFPLGLRKDEFLLDFRKPNSSKSQFGIPLDVELDQSCHNLELLQCYKIKQK